MAERPVQIFKRTNVFEPSLPLKPHVWSGNFPLVSAFLSLLLCSRVIWFHEGSEGKLSASAGKALTETYFCHGKNNLLILFSTTSKEHEKSHETRLFSTKTSCLVSKAEEPGELTQALSARLNFLSIFESNEPFEALPIPNCYSLTSQHKPASEHFLCVSSLCFRIKSLKKLQCHRCVLQAQQIHSS